MEDKAVDLYVLERAFASTHPNSEPLFASVSLISYIFGALFTSVTYVCDNPSDISLLGKQVLKAYEIKSGGDWKAIIRKLDEGIVYVKLTCIHHH